MKNLTLALLLISFSYVGSAQQMFLEVGSGSTSMKYKNSSGESLDNLLPTNNNFMQFGYRYSKPDDFLTFTLACSYSGYGAIGSDTLFSNFMEYRLNYGQLHAGADVRVISLKGFEINIKANGSLGVMLQGTQTLNNQVFDLSENDEFDNLLLSFALGISATRPVSENASIFVQFMNSSGAPAGVNQSEAVERWKIYSNNLSFGVLIDLNN
jgi:hypothetical protein